MMTHLSAYVASCDGDYAFWRPFYGALSCDGFDVSDGENGLAFLVSFLTAALVAFAGASIFFASTFVEFTGSSRTDLTTAWTAALKADWVVFAGG